MDLPKEFKNRITEMLGAESELYFENLRKPIFRGVRANLLKCTAEFVCEKLKNLRPTPFCDFGFYTDESGLGNHPLHHAGAFYLQEPSAMSAVTALSPQKGERVLDACASPGGKSTQIASLIGDEGLLVSNEYVFGRTSALVSNIERLGVKNAVVTSADTEVLGEKFEGFFDKVLVDAPCSGEGMIRKMPEILQDWSENNIRFCAERQLRILSSCARALRQGGRLCYSTCTLSYEENVGVVSRFLWQNPEFRLIEIEKPFGRPAEKRHPEDDANIGYARYIFNIDGGEGHFVALMEKEGGAPNARGNKTSFAQKDTRETALFKKFREENFESCDVFSNGYLQSVGERVYYSPFLPPTDKLRIVRSGLFLGTEKNGRFQPSHALYAAAGRCSSKIVSLDSDEERTARFLHGEEIPCDEALKGFAAVTIDGIPLGFGKASNGRLKNHYPKGLRTCTIDR